MCHTLSVEGTVHAHDTASSLRVVQLQLCSHQPTGSRDSEASLHSQQTHPEVAGGVARREGWPGGVARREGWHGRVQWQIHVVALQAAAAGTSQCKHRGVSTSCTYIMLGIKQGSALHWHHAAK